MKLQPAYSYRKDPSVPGSPDDRPIIVFDGHCVLCSGWINFVLRHDQTAKFRLLPAQTDLGRAIYLHFDLDPDDYQTNILIMDGIAWVKSESSIRMAEGLGFPWRLAAVARALPLSIRDFLYSWVARNRFRWFGHRSSCYLPSDSVRSRFLGYPQSS